MWTELSGLIECPAKLIPTSSNTFITMKQSALLEYDVDKDSFTEILHFRDHFDPVITAFEYAFAFNNVQQMLYIYDEQPLYNSQGRRFITYDLNNGKCKILTTLTDHGGHYSNCILLNDSFHLIGGTHNNKHLCWDEKSLKFQRIHEFEAFTDGYYTSHDIAHVKSKKILLIFGGVAVNSGSQQKTLDVIHKYDIVKQQWSTLNVKMPFIRNTFGVTCVLNDEYVLLFGGFEDGESSDVIWIYCVSTQTFRKSPIKCPQAGIFKACTIRTTTDQKRNELAVFGFVRNIKQDHFTPVYLMKLIQSYYWTGTTFLIEVNKGHHWKINTLDLF